jgi:hypothetical protein
MFWSNEQSGGKRPSGSPFHHFPHHSRSLLLPQEGLMAATPKEHTTAAKVYRYLGIIGAILFVIGCFCPIDANNDASPAYLFLSGLSGLSQNQSMAAGAQVLLAFWMLFIAGRSLLGALLGGVEDLRVTAVQAWVVIIAFYWFYFGTPLPLHLAAGLGWSVLYLGATLLTFGSFRLAMELEDDEEEVKRPLPKRK